MKQIYLKYTLCFLAGVFSITWLPAEVPEGYYDITDGKSGAELKSSMHLVARKFINLDYDGFTAQYWGENYFKRSDWNIDGYYWDMYSNTERSVYSSSELAREHCMPRSWWGSSSDYGDANSDLNNLFPADFKANNSKSNWPLGTINPAQFDFDNGLVKVGQNVYPGYSGKVFEPADIYKGDFARTYFYMVTCYEDYADRWKDEGIKSMLNNESYPVFQDWAVDMLLEWHRMDPVSPKEQDRNDSVFILQQNRNPFIDIPDLAEYIWGNKKEESLVIENKVTLPTLITPISGTQLDFGNVMTNRIKTHNIPLRGLLFTNPIQIEFIENTSGFFSVENEILPAQVNQSGGYALGINYQPTEQGKHTAKLRLSGMDIPEPVDIYVQANGVFKLDIDPVTPTDDMDVILFYTGPWDKESLPENFATNAKQGPYANGDFSFRISGEYLIVEYEEPAEILQFSIYPRNVWASNQNHLYVYEGGNSSALAEKPTADFDNTFVVNNTYNNTPEIQLNPNSRAIKIEYLKVAQNVGINNLILARKKVTSLNEERTDPIIYVLDETVYIRQLGKGETIRIYDILGNLLVQQKTTDDHVIVPVNRKGIFILKTEKETTKFIIP